MSQGGASWENNTQIKSIQPSVPRIERCYGEHERYNNGIANFQTVNVSAPTNSQAYSR